MTESVPQPPARRAAVERLATGAILALFLYLLVVLAPDARIGGVTLPGPRLAALVIAGAVGLRHVICRSVDRHLVSTGLLLNLSLSSCALAVSLLLADPGSRPTST
jgi:hypothetical protein